MKKIYVDGSWFRPFTAAIRNQMMEDAKKKWGDVKLFDPSSTDASKKFDKAKDLKERIALAMRIYKDNIEQIEKCDILIYGTHENDLGTASDLGNAIRLNKDIYAYNYLSREFTKINNAEAVAKILEVPVDNKINVFTAKNGMSMGVIFGFNSNHRLNYLIDKGLSDNIMLRMNHTKFFMGAEGVPQIDETPLDETYEETYDLRVFKDDKNLNFEIPDLELFNSIKVIVTSVS